MLELAGQPLLGRARELELLVSFLDGIETSGQALMLRGAPGIGKSRLLAEAAAQARARGMTLLSATGVQSETRLSFAGLHQLLRPVRKRVAELPEVHRDALDAAFGLTHKPAPERFRVAMATLDLLAEVAGERPLLLVVDDAHWLDPPTADVLAFVARRIESDPIVLLAATRDGYPSSTLTSAGLPEQPLEGLDELTAASLLDAAAPNLPPPTRERVLREAAGNPLALLELPATSHTDGERSVLPLSERLERAFAGRVAELPEDTRLALLAAALDDGENVVEILRAASAVAGRALELDALEPARAAALVDIGVGTLHFRHPLIRSAVWQSADVRRRRQMHEALAEVLHGDPDRRVWHRAALVTGTHEELARELEAAGVRAYRRGAIDVALAALRRAVQLSDPSRRATQVLAAAELAYERGRPDLAVPLMRELDFGELERGDAGRAWILREHLQSGALADQDRVRDLIAVAEQAEDRDVHHELLWLVATRTWWAGPDPATRRLVVAAADRAGPPTAADPRLVAIHAYADSFGNAARVIDCLRAAAASTLPVDDPPGYLASAGLICGAFEESLAFSPRGRRARPGRRTPGCAPAAAGGAGDERRPLPRSRCRAPCRRGSAPARDRAQPAGVARRRGDGARDAGRDRRRPGRGRPGDRPRRGDRADARRAAFHLAGPERAGARGARRRALRRRVPDPRAAVRSHRSGVSRALRVQRDRRPGRSGGVHRRHPTRAAAPRAGRGAGGRARQRVARDALPARARGPCGGRRADGRALR